MQIDDTPSGLSAAARRKRSASNVAAFEALEPRLLLSGFSGSESSLIASMPAMQQTVAGAPLGDTAVPDLVAAFGTVKYASSSKVVVIVPGDSVKAPVVVTNTGTAAAAGKIALRLYISADQTLSGDDVLLKESTNKSLKLSVGKSKKFTLKGTITDEVLPGSYYLIAQIDTGGTIVESNPDNNLAATTTQNEVVWKFGNVGTRKSVKLTLADTDGTLLTYSLSGKGTGEPLAGELHFTGTNLQSKASISTKKSSTPGDKGRYEAPADFKILVDGTLGRLTASKADITGPFNVTGDLRALRLGNVNSATMTCTPAHSTDLINLTFGNVENLSIASETPLASLTASKWLDTDATLDKIDAPFMGDLTMSSGDFQANIISSSLGTVRIRGSVVERAWDIRGPIGDIIVIGQVRDSLVRSEGSMGNIVLGAVFGSDFLAGISSACERHATQNSDFTNTNAQIASVYIIGNQVDGSNLRCVTDSNFSAATIGSVDLMNVAFYNDGTDFGLFARNAGTSTYITGNEIGQVTYVDSVTGEQWHGRPKSSQSPGEVYREYNFVMKIM